MGTHSLLLLECGARSTNPYETPTVPDGTVAVAPVRLMAPFLDCMCVCEREREVNVGINHRV